MASKKPSSRPPESLIEQTDSISLEQPIVSKETLSDVAIENTKDDINAAVMSTVVDIIYGESYRNFEVALFEVGMDMDKQQLFQAYVYGMLMNGNFLNIPGAQCNRGLAMAIAQAAEYFYGDTEDFAEFIVSLDKWHMELLSPEELHFYRPITNSRQLTNLVDSILRRLHP